MPRGQRWLCAACGQRGHIAARDGKTCSRSHLAAMTYIAGKSTQHAAVTMTALARQHGISKVAVRHAVQRILASDPA